VVLLQDILPIDLLEEHIENGVVRRQVHPLYPNLFILNYSEKAQFDRIWDAVTNVCRGLIITGECLCDAQVVARGFNKFHNLNTEYIPATLEANLPKAKPPLVTKKLDGSMGVLYFWDSKWWVATRGSFDSDQARWATAFVRAHYERLGTAPTWVDHYSPVCEIIYQANRIVVDYDFEGLVMLAVINNWNGHEVCRDILERQAGENGLPVVEQFDKSLAECAAEDTPNEEGYVLTYSNGVKVKVKFAEYVRLHRILTGLNPKAIWELLAKKADDTVDLILQDEKMPLSFKEWFGGWVGQLRSRYTELEQQAQAVLALRPTEVSRKEVALYFKETPHLCSILFAMLDGKNYAEIIWDKLRPKATDVFKQDGE
jgi:hypothetical protein